MFVFVFDAIARLLNDNKGNLFGILLIMINQHISLPLLSILLEEMVKKD